MADEDKGSTAEEQAAPESLDSILARSWDDEDETTSTEDAPSSEESAETDDEVAEETEDTDAEVPDEDEDTEADDEDEETDEGPPLEAPQHWSEEDRKVFANIDKTGQEFLLRRHKEMEGDYTRRTQEIAPVRKAIEPYRPMLQQLGLSEGDAVQQLLAAQYALLAQPEQAVEQIARAYLGQDWKKRFTGADADEDDEVDPQVQKVLQEVEQLKRGLAGQQQTQLQQQQESAQQAIEAFKTETDESGNPLRPHFDAVQEHMGKLISSGVAESLEDAYDKAIWADPTLRKQLLAAETKQTTAERKKVATKARSKVLPKSKGAAEVKPEPKTLDDLLAKNLEGLG